MIGILSISDKSEWLIFKYMQAFANPRQNIDIAWYLLEST